MHVFSSLTFSIDANALIHEMNNICTPKFHMLHEYVHDALLKMNGFFDMGEDAIERWNQIRMRHHARIITLIRDKNKRIFNQSMNMQTPALI